MPSVIRSDSCGPGQSTPNDAGLDSDEPWAQEEDIEVVAQISDEAEIPRLIEEIKPEFLIVSIDARRFGPLAREDMLQRHPELQIIALANDGNSFTLFSASDGVRSMTYKEAEAEILDVLRSNCRTKEGG